MSLDVSVVVPCYTDARWDGLNRAVESLRGQVHKPCEIVVAVDHNPVLAERVRAEIPGVVVATNDDQPRGLASNRNCGADLATSPVIAFLDDDETAPPNWLSDLIEPLSDPNVIGTGGSYRARWEGRKPAWFPDEFGWVVGASYQGMPLVTSRVRNVWGGNMAVRTEVLRSVGGFRVGFGKEGDRSEPEDTDFCIRAAAATPDRFWMYVPEASIDHVVPVSRGTFRFFLRRCYQEGHGKIGLRNGSGVEGSLADEGSFVRDQVLKTMPQYLIRRRPSVVRASVVAAGLVAAALGAGSAVAASIFTPRRTDFGADAPAKGVAA